MDPYKNEANNIEFKRHLPLKYLGAFKTTYLAFI